MSLLCKLCDEALDDTGIDDPKILLLLDSSIYFDTDEAYTFVWEIEIEYLELVPNGCF